MLPYAAYASSVRPTVFETPLLTEELAELIFKITGAKRVIFGHTHQPQCKQVGPVTFYNGGFWSKAFADPECTIRLGEQTFVWVRPREEGAERTAELCVWQGSGEIPVRSLCAEPAVPPEMQPA
jgi:hypothetical protein